ncbi:MAG: hypothetical protein GF355_16700 [Candidatus Eisenbacteria bacterium]|nr:hypothetical protein [Candidatus Eisenbacteria bacterium]
MRSLAHVSILLGAAAAAVLGLVATDASLLPALLFWVAVGQGLFALAAAAELSNAHWIKPARTTILNLHPLLLMFPVLFLVLARNMSIYPWTEHPTAWLNPAFFIARNVAMLVVTWLAAWAYARASLAGSDHSRTLAVVYLFIFVANQSLVAFDWVMPLEYPWISTLFGGYFFVEALYAGIAVSAILVACLTPRDQHALNRPLGDAATLLFGFALLWAGQMFAQYLVIWYGNLPHEVSFVAHRVIPSPMREMAVGVLFALFVIPFTVFFSRTAKTTPLIIVPMAGLIFAGIFVERLLFLIPSAPLNPLLVILTTLAVGAPFVLMLRSGMAQARVEGVV